MTFLYFLFLGDYTRYIWQVYVFFIPVVYFECFLLCTLNYISYNGHAFKKSRAKTAEEVGCLKRKRTQPKQNTKINESRKYEKTLLEQRIPSALFTFIFVPNVALSSSWKIKERRKGWEGMEKLILEHSCVWGSLSCLFFFCRYHENFRK